MDMTNYNKARMEDLSGQIGSYKEQYNELVASLEAKINEMHNHWVEDPAAEAVYQQLKTQFNNFKSQMGEGYDKMSEYQKQVTAQVDRYTQAEQEAMNAING